MSDSVYLNFQKKDQDLLNSIKTIQPNLILNNQPFNIPNNNFQILNNTFQVPSNVPSQDFISNSQTNPETLLDLMERKDYLNNNLESSYEYSQVLDQRKKEVDDSSGNTSKQILLKQRMIQELERVNVNHDLWIHGMKMFFWVISFWFIFTFFYGSNKISKIMYIFFMILTLFIYGVYIFIIVRRQIINLEFVNELGSESEQLSKDVLRIFLSPPSECKKTCSN